MISSFCDAVATESTRVHAISTARSHSRHIALARPAREAAIVSASIAIENTERVRVNCAYLATKARIPTFIGSAQSNLK
jgi:hypothetical protein